MEFVREVVLRRKSTFEQKSRKWGTKKKEKTKKADAKKKRLRCSSFSLFFIINGVSLLIALLMCSRACGEENWWEEKERFGHYGRWMECEQNANERWDGRGRLSMYYITKLPAWRMVEVELKGERGKGTELPSMFV